MEYDLKRSKDLIGQLYPILVDPKGNILDGKQRLQANGKWERRILRGAKTDKDRLLVGIVANSMRRTVSKGERKEQFTRLAEILTKEEEIKDQAVSTRIAELTGFSERWIRECLPRRFKAEGKARETETAEVLPQKEIRLKPKEEPPKETIYCEGQINLLELVKTLFKKRNKELICDKCQSKDLCLTIERLKEETK